jgi:hypothetical protein
MLVTNIKSLNQELKDKAVKEVVQEIDGISIYFIDGTQFKIRTFQYQLFLNT